MALAIMQLYRICLLLVLVPFLCLVGSGLGSGSGCYGSWFCCYFGSGSGLLLNINISKIIKIGGEKVVKEFVVGTQSYDHGSGFVVGYNINLMLGKLPFSFSLSSRFNTISFEESGGSSFWASLSAGIGLEL